MTDRLTREDWVAVALKELARRGHSSLSANRLASVLGVSRGSFYWHFQNIEDFETSVLKRWQQLTTDSIIAEMETLESAEQRLATLVRTSLSAKTRLERAVRCWAIDKKSVARFVSRIDVKRMEYVRQLLVAIGGDHDDVGMRAQVLYWASVGMIMGPVSDQMAAIQESDLVSFFALPNA